ncbi:hypothetical protein [Nocardia phage NBR1]|uniref:hypothetical protein n=1 Tax=Nocardia phage NBR1 TaxID=1109711 RepID=UPI00023EEDEB|nr:hypothetical protein NoPhNBR1_gp40 [Nocardia phage NBR1]AEV52253.1 hypothetical protein [Nocardia phage NBR1]
MPNPFSKAADTSTDQPNHADRRAAAAAAKAGSVDRRAGRGGMDLGKAPSSFVSVTDYAGELLAVYPTEYVEAAFKSPTTGEWIPAVMVDFLVCTGDDEGVEHTDSQVSGAVLVGSLKRKIGQAVILKIGQGEAKQKGFSKPWIVLDTTEEEDAQVKKVVAATYGG